MPLLHAIAKLTTARGRAYRTLLQAEFFAVGRIGASARIAPTERALTRVMHESSATAILLDLLAHASVPGQLYALLGLRECSYAGIEELLQQYRERTEEVTTQTGCLRGSQPVRNIVAQIADGTYLLETHEAS
jgi:hypothetical protein